MNVTALGSRFAVEKSAGNIAPNVASRERPTADSSPSVIVTLSGTKGTAGEAAGLTYAPTQPAAAAPFPFQPLLLPTRANVAMLAAQAGETINAKLDAAGIPREPGFELVIEDVNSAHVTVKGGRTDAKAIEDLVNGDKALQMEIHNAYAIASHIPGIERSMAYQKEYQAAQTQQQIDQVNARYADLLSGNAPIADIGLYYEAKGLQVLIDGQSVQG